MINFHPGSIVHDMHELVTSNEKKVIALFLEFRLKFLDFLSQPNETSGNGKRSKFSFLPGPGVLLILKFLAIGSKK